MAKKIKRIWIDPGHGGSDPGAAANGVVEKVINLIVAMELTRLLKKAGFIVGISRTNDLFVGLTERCQMANQFGADIFVSVHHNAGGGDGYECIHSIHHGAGADLAHEIADAFGKLGQNPHGAKAVYSREGQHGDYYAVIRQTNMPAVITEYAFLDSPDVKAVDTTGELLAEANAIFTAILNYCKE